MAFLTPEKSRLLEHPGIGFSRVQISDLDASSSVRFATARVVARPPGPIRPGETSLSGRRGLSTRAFPRKGPPRESVSLHGTRGLRPLIEDLRGQVEQAEKEAERLAK